MEERGPADIEPAADVMDRRWSGGQSQSSDSESRVPHMAALQ